MSDYSDLLGLFVQIIGTIAIYRRSRSDAEEAARPPPVILTPVDKLRTGFRPDGMWRGDVSQDEYDDRALRADLERLE